MSELILSLDPSSKRSGWAALTLDGQLLEAGVLTPDKARVASERRIGAMCRDLEELLDQIRPTIIVIEWPSGHVGANRHKGGGAGLSVYGAAVGGLWREAEAWKRAQPADDQARILIQLVTETQWTAGIPKGRRQAAMACEYPTYDPELDPGGDVSDALGLGLWWCRERRAAMLKETTA